MADDITIKKFDDDDGTIMSYPGIDDPAEKLKRVEAHLSALADAGSVEATKILLDLAKSEVATRNRAKHIRRRTGPNSDVVDPPDEETIAQVLSYLADGEELFLACAKAGIPDDIAKTWIRVGRERPDSPQGRFVEAVEAGQEMGTEIYADVLRRSALGLPTGNPKSARAMLERRGGGGSGSGIAPDRPRVRVLLELD